VSEHADLQDAARASAHELVEDVADRLQLDRVKAALADLAQGRDAAAASCEVVSAVPLDASQRTRIEDRLRAEHGNVLVRYRVEPAILGGLVVRVGDRLVDGSVAARLGQLRQALLGSR
jgi:F0F1-type ATP synthase delta subunit